MNARNHSVIQESKTSTIKSQYIFPCYYMLPKIEIYMNRVQKFIILTVDLVLTYVLQLQTKLSKKDPFIL